MHAIRETWAKINQPHVVAAEAGYNARRTILGAIAGEKVKYKHANEFLGGTLSRKSFNEAKERRLTALEDGDVSALAGKRKMRSDNLQEKYPMACCRVEQSILERTQPSPNLTKTNHDYRQRGDHIRSDADNSLVCVHPEKCETHRVHYMTGTQQHLYHQCMDDLQVAFSAGRAEIASISRSSFDKMVPFYVVEQSIRSCLCVHCYKAKLITVALYQLWPTLHHGDNSGSGCTCNCGFCSDGACRTFLPFATEKSVHGMGDLSDLLLCEKVFIYRGQNGKDVKAHRSVCVSGHCPTCQRKQAAFFGCPRHQGTTDRRFPSSAATLGACPSAMEGQPGRVKWSMFTSVDAEGRATDARRLAGPQPPDDDDGDWEPRVASDTSRPKKAVATKTGTVDDFTKEFKDIFRRYIPHRRQYHNQRSAFHETLRTLEEGTVVFVFDFQEQLQLIEQDEVQAQHWQHESVTIFPCPIYFKWKGRVWSYSFQVLSDDRTQDHAWVQHVMFKILTEHVPALMRKLGAPAMVLAIFFTDNCAKQFKCRFHFGWLASRAVMVCDTNGESTNVPVHIEHHYFGSCHGKSSSDSEGANTKGVTRHNIINQSWVVQSPRHLCTLLGESMDFMLLEPTEDEAMTFETARTSSRGGDQLLMTKVWGGESRSDERKTLLITKKPNTLLGRKYIFQAAGAISGAVRSACRSEAKAIKVQGCQAISKTVATETPGVLATYTLSCSHDPLSCRLCW
ncbi:conserved unknown protein [Ectocarpus siliculosus]|uniref:Uncharacterized protein n=1 Tax=Ectocarpus siliculosus TaxID=2880 RepID=D7G3S2_ECTSI|nr:conserved unknown protein [Ectocarpus siliculosus]|eukprot:CBJ33599.1 conserved unknown protein [Ectocarpus siliculosus]